MTVNETNRTPDVLNVVDMAVSTLLAADRERVTQVEYNPVSFFGRYAVKGEATDHTVWGVYLRFDDGYVEWFADFGDEASAFHVATVIGTIWGKGVVKS